MKQKLLLTLIALFSVLGGVKAAITTADLIASTNGNEHPFFVVGTSNGYYWTHLTSPTATLANRAQFAFYETSTSGVYKIKNTTDGNWLSYTSAASYSSKTGFVTFVTEEASAGLFKMEKVNNKDANTPCYQIRPLKTDASVANIYLNWLNGVPTGNPLDGNTSVGVYTTAATGDAGSGWSLVDATLLATPQEIADAKSIIGTGVGYPKTTSAAYIALNGLTDGASVGDVENAKNNYIACTDINLPEEGHAYKLSMVSTDGSKTWALVANGTTLTPTLDGSATTFYCHKINNGNDRFVFIAANGNILAYKAVSTNYDNLYVGNSYLYNDFTVGALVGVSSNMTSTKEQRLGYVYLTSDHRSSSNNYNGCFIVSNSNGAYTDTTAPFHNGTYTSAVKIEEVNDDNINNSNEACIAKLKIDALVSGYMYRNYYGEGYGHYTITDLGGNTYTWAQHNSAIGNAADNTEIPVFRYTLNMPQAGSFLRIKGYTSNKYISGNSTTSGNIPLVETADENSILCYTTAGELIGYKNGLGMKETSLLASVSDTKDKHAFYAAPFALGAYMIKATTSTQNSKVLVDWTSGKVDRWTKENDTRSTWVVEEVTELPVTIGSLKFATFCSPVPVTVPSGVTAYVATLSGETILLYELPNNVIPANCGVLLHADAAGTYNFTIDGDDYVMNNNILTGTVPAIVAPANAYTLQQTQGDNTTCAFYRKTGTIAGFKSYIVSAGGDSRLSFAIDDETGIGSIVNKKANGDGMFLIDGKVVIIKNGVKYNVNGIRY